jgi:hypothetical protein
MADIGICKKSCNKGYTAKEDKVCRPEFNLNNLRPSSTKVKPETKPQRKQDEPKRDPIVFGFTQGGN